VIRIDWRTIPHKAQRYLTSGDWFWTYDDDATQVLNIRVSELSHPFHEFCLGLHELVEAMLCRSALIGQKIVDDFDIPYEAAHAKGAPSYPCGCPRTEFSDPGGDRHAPYHSQHRVADVVERVVAMTLGIDWKLYDAEVDKPPPAL